MKITKLGHCCLLVEVSGVRIVTDPGFYTTEAHSALRDIDYVLITHEHADHCHTESLAELLSHNPSAQVVCNSGVGILLDEAGITYTCVEGSERTECGGVALCACDGKHAEIYGEVGQVQSTGYLIADTLFLPADSWQVPDMPVQVLALPVAGPWCRIKDAIDFARAVAPTRAFPVHDGMLSEQGKTATYRHPQTHLAAHNIEFTPLSDGETLEV